MNPNYPQDPQPFTPPQEPSLPQPTAPTPTVIPVQSFSAEQPAAPTQYPQQAVVEPQLAPQSYQADLDPYLTAANEPSYGSQPVQPTAFVAEPVAKKKKPVLLILSIASIVLILGLATAAYFAWQAGWFKGSTATESVVTTPSVKETTYDTPEAVEKEINTTQEALDGIDDSQLADDTIADQTLNQ